MSTLEIILIALSLALDVGVVSVGAGALNILTVRRTVFIALIFSLFHAIAPLIGWSVGYLFSGYVLEYGRIIGFILLLLVGLKMLKDALGSEDIDHERNIFSNRVLLVLAFATSIDALVIGITFSLLETSIVSAILIIGIITFVVSLLGAIIGTRSRHLAGTKIEVLGALALIALAFKVLLF